MTDKIISLSELDLNSTKRVGLEFDFDEDIIDRVRQLPDRKWWPEEKIWHIPFRPSCSCSASAVLVIVID